jgi:hypothetical protein
MTSYLRALGLAFMALTAIGAVMASAAQAGEFTAEKYPATITGTELSEHQFSFLNWTIGCTEASFHSKLGAAAKTMTVGAEYRECSTPGGQEAIVSMESCDFLFHANETLEKDEVDGSVDIKCAEAEDGIHVEIPATGCTVKIHPQNMLTTMVYTNHKAAGDYDVDINIGPMIKYTQSEQCPGGEGFYFNGEYTGKSTMTGEKEGAKVDVTVD